MESREISWAYCILSWSFLCLRLPQHPIHSFYGGWASVGIFNMSMMNVCLLFYGAWIFCNDRSITLWLIYDSFKIHISPGILDLPCSHNLDFDCLANSNSQLGHSRSKFYWSDTSSEEARSASIPKKWDQFWTSSF